MIRTFVGAVAAVLASLAGLWLMIAPFALGTQAESADWSNSTIAEFSTGLGVAVIGLAGAAAFAAAIYENLVTRGLVTVRRREREPEPAPAPTGASSAELATMLAPLVEALREDLATTNGHRR
ncbi:hypothetical protein [Nonomuraea dietziae]|uniref:hypothetical protein n=1 Tax=Nonomuraea dietziae TaxID=65515 RepID=UPI0033F7158C